MAYDYGQGFKGAAGGALAGASVGGPFGALVGGGLGLLGGFGGGPSEQEKANQKRLEDFYNYVRTRQAPQMGPAAQAGYSTFRTDQRGLVSQLQDMAAGRGPSLAAEQLRAATDRNARQQQAFANTGRGGPLAAQQAMNNTAMLGAQSAQDATQARIAEQNMALQNLGLTLHGARGADEETNRFNTGQTNEAAQANLLARLRAMGYSDEAALGVLQQMGGAANSQANRPGLGDQILSGGAGMFAMGATQKASAPGGGFRPSGAQNGLTQRAGYPHWGGV